MNKSNTIMKKHQQKLSVSKTKKIVPMRKIDDDDSVEIIDVDTDIPRIDSKGYKIMKKQQQKKSGSKTMQIIPYCETENDVEIIEIDTNILNNRKSYVMKEIPYENSFASHPKKKYLSPKNNIDPRLVCLHSAYKFIFICPKCKHEFFISLDKVCIGRWCGYCANHLLCGKEKCKLCFKKSFASHPRIINWSDKNEISPQLVFKNAHKNYIFDCHVCKHEISITPHSITADHWCGYCANHRLCGKCDYCNNKTYAIFEFPENYKWSAVNNVIPKLVFLQTTAFIQIDCNKCSHTFNVSGRNFYNGFGCSYCYGSKLCDNAKCLFCHEKSFASYIGEINKRGIVWSKKNLITPREVRLHSDIKIIFNCTNGEKKHIFTTTLNDMSTGRGCPFCKFKTEKKLLDTLSNIFPTIKAQFKRNWCKNELTNRFLPFDFCILKFKIIIELDGAQHFRQVSNWKCPLETHKRDLYKMQCANKYGFRIIRILQDDVWRDTYDWGTVLKSQIEELSKNNIIINSYLCRGDEYNIFLDDTMEHKIITLSINGYIELTDKDTDVMVNMNGGSKLSFINESDDLITDCILLEKYYTSLLLLKPNDERILIKYKNIKKLWKQDTSNNK